MTHRLFIGIELSPELREGIAHALDPVAIPQGLRVLAQEGWHLTLKFLGGVEEERIAEVASACRHALCEHARFELELAGAGAFPTPRRARAVWVGIGRGAAELSTLASALGPALEPLGLEEERRGYRAHVTFARGKPVADVRALVGTLAVPQLAMQVTEAALFRSYLSQRGARYEVIERLALGS
jgi:2'-5' RNA ligase